MRRIVCGLLAVSVATTLVVTTPIFADTVSIVDLGELGGGWAEGSAINNDGWVVGHALINSEWHAFLYKDGTMQDLGTLPGANLGTPPDPNASGAAGINNHGWVVGTSKSADGSNHAFLYHDGKMQDLGTVGVQNYSVGAGINDSGWVTGNLRGYDAPFGHEHAFLYRDGSMQDLGPFGSDPRKAANIGLKINAQGWILGQGTDGNNYHPFLYANGTMQDLGTLGGFQAGGAAINDRGQIIGESATAANPYGMDHIFLYWNGRMEDLGNLGNSTGLRTFVSGLNNCGWIIGTAEDDPSMRESHAIAYDYNAKKIINLNDLIDASSPLFGKVTLESGDAINDRGQIVASGYYKSGATPSPFSPPRRAFLLTPKFEQQGSKLVGTGAIGPALQGLSVALSADGNTALVGGWSDNNYVGAAWVFTRSGGAWTQQAKLVGSGAVGQSRQGMGVALSADGNTALVAGLGDNNYFGAAWVFTRSGGAWTQQAKLVGTGVVGPHNAQQGSSLALSADGNTAVVGGPADNNGAEATWVFTRSGSAWTQQAKLVGTGTVGPLPALQGDSVTLSADGNTALVGGDNDNNEVGAAWVFTRSGGAWTQQVKLIGSGALGQSHQGQSVALSADGNTAMVGGPRDNDFMGATWVFTRSSSVWTQQAKLVGSGVVGAYNAQQGSSVRLSADGKTAVVGGPADNNGAGATWVFTRSGSAWTQPQGKLIGTGAINASNPAIKVEQGNSVALSADGNTAIAGGGGDNNAVGATWVFTKSPPACAVQ